MPKRWPMMSREDSSVLELSIYSEASSSSGDEDDDDDLASEWSEWEDPLWVKDDNLRRPAARGDATKVKALKVRSPSSSGLRRSSTMGGGSGSAQLIVRKLSALSIAQVVVPAASPTSATTPTTPTTKSDKSSRSISLSKSLSFEGQESGAGSPLSTPSTSSASTPISSRSWPAASLSASHLRVPRKVTELVAQDEADDAWSLDGRSSGGSLASDVDTIHEEEDQDNHQESVAWQYQSKGVHHDDDDDNGGDDGVDDGSVEEEVEAELSSDEGGTDDDDDDNDQKAGDDDDDVVEEKGIEYLLKKYFPESLAAIEQEAPPEPNKEKKKKKKKKSSHKRKEKKEKKEKRTKSERTLGCGRGEAQIKRIKDVNDDEVAPPSAASRLVFSVDGVMLERRDKAREKYQSLFIPSLDLRGSADADADADNSDTVNSDADVDVDGERKPSSAGEGRRRVRHRSERERRMPQSAREGFGRKSARELGMIFRCRSREDVNDDERNVVDADAAVASPRTRRVRSRTFESVPPSEEAQPSPRAKAKHSWVIKREDGHQQRPSALNGNIERERVGQVYGRLSVSTSSFALAADSSSSSAFSASGVLSPRKKTGSFRSLLSGRRATGSYTGAAEAQQQLRRDAISAEHPSLTSASSSSSWSSKSALPFSSISSSTPLSSSSSTTTSSPPPSPSSSATTSSTSATRRGRSSSLNKAAGLFKRSGSLRKTRADDNIGGLASGDSRSGSAGGDQQAQQKEKEKKEKVVGGIKKSWREVKSYFSSDREVKTYFNGSAGMPPTLES